MYSPSTRCILLHDDLAAAERRGAGGGGERDVESPAEDLLPVVCVRPFALERGVFGFAALHLALLLLARSLPPTVRLGWGAVVGRAGGGGSSRQTPDRPHRSPHLPHLPPPAPTRARASFLFCSWSTICTHVKVLGYTMNDMLVWRRNLIEELNNLKR